MKTNTKIKEFLSEENAAYKHLPGRHNQKLHGRRGASDRPFDIPDNVDTGSIVPVKGDIKKGFPFNSAVEVAHKISNTAWGNDYPPTRWDSQKKSMVLESVAGKKKNPSSIVYSVDKDGNEKITAYDRTSYALVMDNDAIYRRPNAYDGTDGRVLTLTRRNGETKWKITSQLLSGDVRVNRYGEIEIDYDMDKIKDGWALPFDSWG